VVKEASLVRVHLSLESDLILVVLFANSPNIFLALLYDEYDTGGSIRMPAFFNGVFGHKPSSGLVPNEGQYPCASGEAMRYLTTGPLCRKAEDLWPLLKLMAGELLLFSTT